MSVETEEKFDEFVAITREITTRESRMKTDGVEVILVKEFNEN